MQRLHYYIWGDSQKPAQPAAVAEQCTANSGPQGSTVPGHSSAGYSDGGAESGVIGARDTSAPAAAAQGSGHKGVDSSPAHSGASEGGERARRAPLETFKETRMLAGGADSSTQLSAFLAAGCLSPRMVHAAVAAAAAEHLGGEQCQWLVMHLIIR